MPRIIVLADVPAGQEQDLRTLEERVQASDLESGHFAAQLVERLAWAVEDAEVAERERDHAPAIALT